MTHDERSHAFVGRPTSMDVGIGVLYFFTSHMVIRTMYYIGVGRSSLELTAFFIAVIVSVIFAHLLAKPFLWFRLFAESVLGVPAVSVVAALGVTLALISMLPRISPLFFYVSGILLGLSCGWIVIIWTSTIHVDRPDPNSFFIHPSLLVAVAVYFLFRCVSSFSETITQGFLLALPLIALVFIIRGYSRSPKEEGTDTAESAQSLQVLVIVAAVFALGGSIAVSLSGRADDVLSSGFNYMVLFEVLALTLMVFCCWILCRFSRHDAFTSPRVAAIFTFCILFPPLFFTGLLMGGAGIPADSPNALWESNVWVLIIAIFAYDIRESLYAIKGLAVGLMFETMCVGQMIAYIATLNLIPYAFIIALGLTALYFGSIYWQLFCKTTPKSKAFEIRGSTDEASIAKREPAPPERSVEGEAPTELLAYCQELALIHGLTPREAEILGLIAMGRSAKYIADELLISLNTTRTHVKHVYEKLNIHSKQELIDLVLFGSGLMG